MRVHAVQRPTLAAGARSTGGSVSVRLHVGTVQHVLGGREPQVSGNTRV